METFAYLGVANVRAVEMREEVKCSKHGYKANVDLSAPLVRQGASSHNFFSSTESYLVLDLLPFGV